MNGPQQRAIAQQLGVTSVPMMVVIKNGQMVGHGVPGAPTLRALDAMLVAARI